MIQRIEQTHEQKMEMYMKCNKVELATMLIECNRMLEIQLEINKKAKYDVSNEFCSHCHKRKRMKGDGRIEQLCTC